MTIASRLAMALAALLVVAAAVYFFWWQPNARLVDEVWLQNATPAEEVAVSRQVLRLPFGNHHDACLCIKRHGGPECVSDLITALRWMPDRGEVVPCTVSHCIDALRNVTGVDAGNSPRDWQAWWRAGDHS